MKRDRTRKGRPGRPMAAHTLKILDVLESDNDWHHRDELVTVGSTAIPPGVALRQNSKQREKQRKYYNGVDTPPRNFSETNMSGRIASGQRSLITRSLQTLTVNGRVEKEEREDGVYFRINKVTKKAIRLIHTDGTVEVIIDPTSVVTEIDEARLWDPATPVSEVEELYAVLNTYSKWWPGVPACRELVRNILNSRNVNAALEKYEDHA